MKRLMAITSRINGKTKQWRSPKLHAEYRKNGALVTWKKDRAGNVVIVNFLDKAA